VGQGFSLQPLFSGLEPAGKTARCHDWPHELGFDYEFPENVLAAAWRRCMGAVTAGTLADKLYSGPQCIAGRGVWRGKIGPMSTDEQGKPASIRIAGLCGSLRAGSFTRAALRVALDAAKVAGAEVSLIDLRDYRLPFVASKDGPEFSSLDVPRLRADVKAADGLVIGTPEYHGSFSGVLKNALDLMGFDEFESKMIGLIGVSGGRMGAFDALNALRAIGRALHAWVLPQQASIPEAWKVFDSAGQIVDQQIENRLREVGREVAHFARIHKCAAAHEFLEAWQQAPENPGGGNR